MALASRSVEGRTWMLDMEQPNENRKLKDRHCRRKRRCRARPLQPAAQQGHDPVEAGPIRRVAPGRQGPARLLQHRFLLAQAGKALLAVARAPATVAPTTERQ